MIMDMALFGFAMFLYMTSAVLMVLEIFIPSFGLLTLMAVGAFVAATVFVFQMGTTVGWLGIVLAAVLMPTVWVATYKLFPKTPLGRPLISRNMPRDAGDAIPDLDRLNDLKGKSGKAVSTLRPVGFCQVDGLRVSCSAQTGMIPKGSDIEVVNVEGQHITVRQKM